MPEENNIADLVDQLHGICDTHNRLILVKAADKIEELYEVLTAICQEYARWDPTKEAYYIGGTPNYMKAFDVLGWKVSSSFPGYANPK